MSEFSQADLERWILEEATGKFHYTKVFDGRVDPKLYHSLREMMRRCRDKGLAYPVDGKDGWWRPADRNIEEVCWWDTGVGMSDNLVLPLGMNKFCYVPLPSLIIVAGIYNAGKTALCINIVNCNLEKWAGKLDFYVSEGAEMMKAKFQNLNAHIPKPPPFKMFRKTEHFSDVLDPDNLSVIDYLRVDMEKPYEIGKELFRIFNKLNQGIAVVAMQKPPGDRKLAFGGASTAFEPTLYLGMDKNVIGFEKIKVPKILDYDPYAVKIQFKLKNGVNFYDVNEIVE
jgi:hypothetical protein